MDKHYFIILSRAHAEELMPRVSANTLARIQRLTEEHGACIAEMQGENIGYLFRAVNGVQIANRVKTAAGAHRPTHGERFERAPDGHINNCAVANGDPMADCQICNGTCPDVVRS